MVPAHPFYDTISCKAGLIDVDDTKRRVSGYLASFGTLDLGNDIILPGSTKRSIMQRGPGSAKNDIFFLHSHDFSRPHGKFEELAEDAKGLRFVSQPLPDTSYSNDALVLYKAGIMVEHSIGFRTVDSEYNRETGVRKLKEIHLFEGSNVTIGMNRNTPFTGFKSMTADDSEAMVRKMLNVIRNERITDDLGRQLEIGIKQLMAHVYALGQQSGKGTAPGGPDQQEGPPAFNGSQAAATIKQFINTF